jgi:hypothetical protein
MHFYKIGQPDKNRTKVLSSGQINLSNLRNLPWHRWLRFFVSMPQLHFTQSESGKGRRARVALPPLP